MQRTPFGSVSAAGPAGWTVASDDDLLAVYPPDAEAYIQISTYLGPEDHEPSATELWECAGDALETSWAVTQGAIRELPSGFALDAEGPTKDGAGVLAFRLWPGRLLFAAFYFRPE